MKRFFLKLRNDDRETFVYVVPDETARFGWNIVKTQEEAIRRGGATAEDTAYFLRNLWFRLGMVYSGVYEESIDNETEPS